MNVVIKYASCFVIAKSTDQAVRKAWVKITTRSKPPPRFARWKHA